MIKRSVAPGKKSKIRRIIMNSAMDLFEERGIENVNFNDIALASGVSRTTVFNYFSTMSVLLTALTEQEIIDIEDYCLKQEKESGVRDVKYVFEQLIDDLCLYPKLLAEMTYTTILRNSEKNPVKNVELIVLERVGDENKMILLMGAFYGIMNHVLVENVELDKKALMKQMYSYIDLIMNS